MKFLKELGERLGLFIAGIVLTIAGALFTYYEFTSDMINKIDSDSKLAAIPIVILIIGVGCIVLTFKKGVFDDPKKDVNTPPQNDGNTPLQKKDEHLPPPLP
jgi:hypothetical protein